MLGFHIKTVTSTLLWNEAVRVGTLLRSPGFLCGLHTPASRRITNMECSQIQTPQQRTNPTSPALGSKSTVCLSLAQHQRTTFPSPSTTAVFPGGPRESASRDQTSSLHRPRKPKAPHVQRGLYRAEETSSLLGLFHRAMWPLETVCVFTPWKRPVYQKGPGL